MDPTMDFPYSYMAIDAESSHRPELAQLVDTPDGPYVNGTGAPLQYFASDPIDSPAIVTTNSGAWPKRYWPEYLGNLPAPTEYHDTEEMAKKLANYFVNQSDPDDVREIPPPMSPYDLFLGFDAVHIYQYGMGFCYKVMCHISRLGAKTKTPVAQNQETPTSDWAKQSNRRLIMLPWIDDGADDFEPYIRACQSSRRFSFADDEVSEEQINYYQKVLNYTKAPSKNKHVEFDSQSFIDAGGFNALHGEQNEDTDSDETTQLSDDDFETSSFGYMTDQSSSQDLKIPSRKKFRSRIPILVSRGSPNFSIKSTGGKVYASNLRVDRYIFKASKSKIPRPIIASSKSRKRKPTRVPFNIRDTKLAYIPHLRSVDLFSGKSKIPISS